MMASSSTNLVFVFRIVPLLHMQAKRQFIVISELGSSKMYLMAITAHYSPMDKQDLENPTLWSVMAATSRFYFPN